MPTVRPPSFVVSSGPCFSHSPAAHEPVGLTKPRPVISTSADRDVGDVVGQHVGRVRHLDAALAAVVDRHAVVADAEHRDDLELRQRVEQRRRRHRAAALHEPADALPFRGEQARLVARLVVVVAAVVRLQRIVEERRQRCGDDDVGAGIGGSSSQCVGGCALVAVRHALVVRARAHSSNPAMSPASPPGVRRASSPSARTRRRSADAGRTRAGARAARAPRRPAASHRLSRPSLDVSVSACARPSRSTSTMPCAPPAGAARR